MKDEIVGGISEGKGIWEEKEGGLTATLKGLGTHRGLDQGDI